MISRYAPRIEAGSGAPPPDLAWRRGVVVRSPNWLGDVLMALPAVLRLRETLPAGCKLWVATRANLRDVWQAVPAVDEVIPVGLSDPFLRLPAVLRGLDAGAIVVLPNSTRAALEACLAKIPVRVGRGGPLRSLLLTRTIPRWRRGERAAQRHQVSVCYDLVARLCPVDRTVPPRTLVCPNHRELLAEAGITAGRSYTVLAPGAAYGPAKQWPVESFAELAGRLAREGARLVVVGTGDDQAAGALICGRAGGAARNLCGRTSLAQLMAVLQQADCVIANDSGAMHLAAALGTPGVAVFGSTNPEATGPLGAGWMTVRAPLPCSPCFRRKCPLPANRYRCLESITPEHVMQALRHLNTS